MVCPQDVLKMSPRCPQAARFLRALGARSPTRLLPCSTSHPLGFYPEKQPRGAASIRAASLRSTNNAQSRFLVLRFLLETWLRCRAGAGLRKTPWKPPGSAHSAHGGSPGPCWEGSTQPQLGPKAHTGPTEHFGTKPFPSHPRFLSSNPNPADFFPNPCCFEGFAPPASQHTSGPSAPPAAGGGATRAPWGLGVGPGAPPEHQG